MVAKKDGEGSGVSAVIVCGVLPKRKRRARKKRGPTKKNMKKKVASRLRVMTLYQDAGMREADIVKTTGYNQSFVHRWIVASKEGRSAEDLPRPGQPKKVTSELQSRIVKLTRGKERASARKIAQRISNEGITISPETVRLTLHNSGLIPHRQQKRPLLTISKYEKAY